jgi:hypothetical protein
MLEKKFFTKVSERARNIRYHFSEKCHYQTPHSLSPQLFVGLAPFHHPRGSPLAIFLYRNQNPWKNLFV